MSNSSPTVTAAASNRQISSFRAARGRRLATLLEDVARCQGRRLHILDLGGSRDYWGNVDMSSVARVTLLNVAAFEFVDSRAKPGETVAFESVVGDATDLSQFADGTIDFVHSNSVIEHVGSWGRIVSFAREARRVGRAGWIQTPAFEFPLDTHSRLPFFHWFAQPVRATALSWSRKHRGHDLITRRGAVDYVNHMSYQEMKSIFPGSSMWTERYLLLPKSYVAYWNEADAVSIS